jgi:type II secretory pathway component GspD/PulD (secretin)
MKPLFALAVLGLVLSGCCTAPIHSKRTWSSFDLASGARDLPPGMINLKEADVRVVLDFYQALSGRTVIRGAAIPNAKITLNSAQSLNRIELLRLLDTALAMQGVTMVLIGEEAVKAVPSSALSGETAPEINLPMCQLPDSSSYMLAVVKLRHRKADEITGIVQPFAALPNSVIAVRGSPRLMLRDYSSNVKAMMRVIAEVDVPAKTSR